MDNTLNGEKSIKNEDTVSWLEMAQHEKNKISFSIPEGLDYAEKHFILCPIQICDSSLSLCMCVKDKR
jgi:hypothetical protein